MLSHLDLPYFKMHHQPHGFKKGVRGDLVSLGLRSASDFRLLKLRSLCHVLFLPTGQYFGISVSPCEQVSNNFFFQVKSYLKVIF